MLLFNSLDNRKEIFAPLNDKKVTMYVCGITPYDTTHLGHAFTYVFFDTLRRILTYMGYKIIYAQNVTDIDDDILRESKKQKKDWKELGNFWTQRYLNDMEKLNVLPPSNFVKATEAIDKMIETIGILLAKGLAYQKNGNVYFEIKKYPSYGSLSRLARDEMLELAEERGGNPEDPLKKDPLDFVLWQMSQKDEPFWESPFGNGRPGWHIECSSMVCKFLGDQIDIHGGGYDLIFPHHESEIAQSESATGKVPFAAYFLHTAMVRYNGEKMSKSLGNLIMINKLLEKHSSYAIRYVLLSHHYRTPWEYDKDELIKAEKVISLFKKAIMISSKSSESIKDIYFKPFISTLQDDMHTDKALIILCGLAKNIVKAKTGNIASLQKTLRLGLSILGFENLARD